MTAPTPLVIPPVPAPPKLPLVSENWICRTCGKKHYRTDWDTQKAHPVDGWPRCVSCGSWQVTQEDDPEWHGTEKVTTP